MVKRFMVYEVKVGEDIKPCVVVSPDELNEVLRKIDFTKKSIVILKK